LLLDRGAARDGLKFGAQLLGDQLRIQPVANDLRTDEHDQLGAIVFLAGGREQIADRALNVPEDGDAVTRIVLI
jgi:hypothetical protein